MTSGDVAHMACVDLEADDIPPALMEALQCVDECGMGVMMACFMKRGTEP